jgi:AraC family transcriptional activator of pobA
MRQTNIPYLDISHIDSIKKKYKMDISDDGIAIFDSLTNLPVSSKPTKITAAAMAVIRTGHATMSINMKTYEVKPHSLILLMPNEIVESLDRSDDFDGISMAISNKTIGELTLGVQSNLNVFLYAQYHPITVIDMEEEELLMQYHNFIWEQIKRRDNIYRSRIDNYLLISLVLEIMNMVNTHRPQKIAYKSRKEEQFERFLTLIGEHYHEQRSVAFYSDKLCITSKYLSSLSKSLTGITASEWIDQSVIQESKALLKNSRYTIQEVSDMMNFPNQSFFGRFFKRHVGCSPKEYRFDKG